MLPSGCLLVTLDVFSLYKIPHDGKTAACEDAFNSTESPVPPTADLYHFIQFNISVNAFTFNKSNTCKCHMQTCLWGSWNKSSADTQQETFNKVEAY